MRDPISRLLPLLCLVLALPYGCMKDGGTEIPNEVRGTLYTVTGEPAANAQVALYPVNFAPGENANADSVRFTTQTGSSGRFSIRRVPDGQYNVVASSGGTFAFRDSVLVAGGASLPGDTLRAAGSLTATVQLQPQHSPQTAVVQVLGTEYYLNVPASGQFTLTLPQGTHRLRVAVSLPEYTPLFRTVTVTSGMHDTLPEPLTPFYSNIPAVTGLTATADSLGRIHLSWNPAGYPQLRHYLVYRVNAGSLTQGEIIATTAGTAFTDTLFAQSFGAVPVAGRFTFTDTVPRSYDYRVRAQSLTDEIGIAFGSATATALPPALHLGIPAPTGFSAVADSHGVVSLSWGKSHPEYAGSFQIYRASGTASPGTLIATSADTLFIDTVFAQSYGQAPKANQFPFTDATPRAYTYRVRAHVGGENGPLANASATALPPALSSTYNSGRWHLATQDAPFGLVLDAVVFNDAIRVIGRASFNSEIGMWSSTNGTTWQAGPPIPSLWGEHHLAVLRDSLWLTGYSGTSSNSRNALYKSGDGETWIPVATPMILPLAQLETRAASNFAFHGLEDRLILLGGYPDSYEFWNNSMFSSEDGGAWEITSLGTPGTAGPDDPLLIGIARANTSFIHFDDNLWVFGGVAWNFGGTMFASNAAFKSQAGSNWSSVAAPAAVLNRGYHSMGVHDGEMWMIGGEALQSVGGQPILTPLRDVWASTNGTDWRLVDINAPFGSRSTNGTDRMKALSFNGKLWLIGGSEVSCANPECTSRFYSSENRSVWYYE